MRYLIHEIPPDFSPATQNCNFSSIRAFRAKGEVEIMLAARPQKITFGEMRDEMGVHGVLS